MVKRISLIVALTISIGSARLAQGEQVASSPSAGVGADSTLVQPASNAADERDVVLFAGETIEFRLPRGWRVQETPVGREVRLLLSPGELPRNPRDFDHGLWLAYHRSPADDSAESKLPAELSRRLRLAAGRDARLTAGPTPCSLAGHAGFRQEFQIASPENRQIDSRGFHALVRTPWGVFECHGVAPADGLLALDAKWREILETLVVHAPSPPPTPLPEIDDAAPLVGSWKSLRARFIFLPDGGVEIRYDRTATFALDEQGNVKFNRHVSRLTGQSRTSGHLLFVTWDDGSRQNFRWKIHRGDLLLTDHSGHVSHLKRLFDLR